VQRQILGPGRLEQYKNGVPFDRFATLREDAVWGGAIVPTPLKDLPNGNK
jgi:hypothetical protein